MNPQDQYEVSSEAIDYLKQIEDESKESAQHEAQEQIAKDILTWANSWITSAKQFRKQAHEDKWLDYQRACDSQYDPTLAKQKKKWQSKAYVDMTASHRETIKAQLFKLAFGSNPILEMGTRAGGTEDQAANVKDMVIHALEKADFKATSDSVFDDATSFGSGFMLAYYEVKTEDRLFRNPIIPQVDPMNQQMVQAAMSGKLSPIGYTSETKEAIIYRGVKLKWVSVWDVYWDPKALEVEGNTVGVRYFLTLGDIVSGVSKGYYQESAAELLRDEASHEIEPDDKTQSLQARDINTNVRTERTEYQKRYECYEVYSRLPAKWADPFLGTQSQDPEKLLPLRIVFTKNAILAVEINKDYDGEPPLIKLDYMRVPGRFIARGIPEMLRHPQAVVNEVVNQRLDEGNLALNPMIVAIEKAVLNPKDMTEGGPGIVVRLDNTKLGPNGDVKNAVSVFDRPDVKRGAGFTEVYEWERIAQERTSANRATMGTSGQVRDANRTLGGQELLLQQSGEKFSYIAMIQEATFMHKVFRKVWKLVYSNLEPADVVEVLGQERAQSFQMMTPEQVEDNYTYIPQGITQQKAKSQALQTMQMMYQQFQGAPWVDALRFFKKEASIADLDPKELIVPEAEAQEIMGKAQAMAQQQAQQMAQQMAPQMAQQMLSEHVQAMGRDAAFKSAMDKKAEGTEGGSCKDCGKCKECGKGAAE